MRITRQTRNSRTLVQCCKREQDGESSAMGRNGALARLSARSELETLLTENAAKCLPLVREKRSSKCDGLRPGCQAKRIASRCHTRATSVLFAQAPQTLPCAATVWERAEKTLGHATLGYQTCSSIMISTNSANTNALSQWSMTS